MKKDEQLTAMSLVETIFDVAHEDAPVLIRLPDNSVHYAILDYKDPLARGFGVAVLTAGEPYSQEDEEE